MTGSTGVAGEGVRVAIAQQGKGCFKVLVSKIINTNTNTNTNTYKYKYKYKYK
jgi:hypothetical protein